VDIWLPVTPGRARPRTLRQGVAAEQRTTLPMGPFAGLRERVAWCSSLSRADWLRGDQADEALQRRFGRRLRFAFQSLRWDRSRGWRARRRLGLGGALALVGHFDLRSTGSSAPLF